ncbi:MAG: type I restriction enzyme HsdR N-terminal domain-containing protein [Cryomorphaceae bacterium]|nr:type I restriction enzyme HsdR N-terminal domain-containing protein [Cryomorphaceae bacterium]
MDALNHRIWDVLNKRWLKYTPEEEVRQHLILFFHHHLGYPLTTMVTEKSIAIDKTTKRFDLLVYRKGKTYILCECKAPKVPIGQKTLDQVGNYNRVFNVPFLLLTNGLQHYVLQFSDDGWKPQSSFPPYS